MMGGLLAKVRERWQELELDLDPIAREFYERSEVAHKKVGQRIREQGALLNVVTDAIIVQSLSNQILFWNKSAEHIFGWKAQEVLGKSANQLLYNQPLPQHQEIYKTVLKHDFWQGELQKITKFGQEIIVESRWTLWRNEHSQPKSIIVIDTKIDPRRN
ncbi:PAS domain S-box protein [Tolypothrix campylonemoides VB511288]|nr:PAS domain S-box protein [Tolypothrix campylonemoides VB511288]